MTSGTVELTPDASGTVVGGTEPESGVVEVRNDRDNDRDNDHNNDHNMASSLSRPVHSGVRW